MATILEIVIEAKNRANAALNQIEGQLGRLQDSSYSFSQKMAGVSTSVGLAGAAMSAGFTIPIIGATTAIIGAAAELEQYQVAFTTMLGSGEKATQMIAELQDFSAKTPFELPEIIQASRQLLAYGFSSEEVSKHLQILGDISSGTGTRITDLTYLYGTLAVQGRVYARDILQFTNRGIPALDALATSMGKTKAEIMAMVSEGKISFEDVEKALATLTGEGGRFNGMMEAQSQTLLGLWSTFKDNFFIAMSQIGLKLVETFDLRNKLKNALEVLEGLRIKLLGLIESNPELVKIAAIFLAITAAIGPLLIGLATFISFIGGLSGAVSVALSAIGAAIGILLSPLGLLAAAIGLVAYAIYNDWFGIGTFISGIVEELGGYFESLRQYFLAIVEDGDYMNDWLTHLPELIRPAVEWIGYMTAKFIELGGVTGIWTIVSTFVMSAFNQMQTTISNVVPIISSALSDLYDAMVWIWEGKGWNIDWWRDITNAMVSLGLVSQSTGDNIASGLFNAGEKASTFIVKMREMKDNAIAAFLQMYAFVAPIISGIVLQVWSMIPTFDQVKETIIQFKESTVDTFRNVVAWVKTEIPVAFSVFKERALEVFQTVSDFVRTTVPAAFEMMKSKVSTAWDSLVASFISAKDTVISVFAMIRFAWQQVVTFLQPTIQNVKNDFQTFMDALPALGKSFQNLYAAIIPIIQDIGLVLGVVFAIVGPAVVNIFSAAIGSLPQFVQGVVDAVTVLLETMHENFLLLVAGFKAAIDGDWTAVWENAKLIAQNTKNGLIGIFMGLWLSAQAIFTFMFTAITNILRQWGVDVDFYTKVASVAWQAGWTAMKDAYDVVATFFTTSWNTLKTWLMVTLPLSISSFGLTWMANWNAIKSNFSAAVDPIVSTLQTVYDFVATKIQSGLGSLKSFMSSFEISNPFSGLSGALSAMVANVQWLIGNIPYLNGLAGSGGGGGTTGNAMGTNYTRGGLTLVGERGPELLNLPRGGQVFNNRDTNSILSGSGGPISIVINEPALYGKLTTSEFVDLIVEEIQRRM